MKNRLFSTMPIKNWLAAGMLLLLFAAIQAPAVGQTEKHAKKNILAVNSPDTYVIQNASPDSYKTAPHLYLEQGLTASNENTSYPANAGSPPVEKKLTAQIYPQPANGNSGDMYLVFNQSLAQGLHITIQDMLDRTYYSGWHQAEDRLLIRFGTTFPVLAPGSYRVTVVSDGMVARKKFMVE